MPACSELGSGKRTALLVVGGVAAILWVAVNPYSLEEPPVEWYSTSQALRRDLAYSALALVVGLVTLAGSRGGSLRRRLAACMAATVVGTSLIIVDGLQLYFDEFISFFRAPPPPTWSDWKDWTVRLAIHGATSTGIASALILILERSISRISLPARRVVQGAAILLALILIDQGVNPDDAWGGSCEHCVSCGADRGERRGKFHGFFEYHEGIKQGTWTRGFRGFWCFHQWDGDFHRESY